jgi:hypothetical protein
MEVEAIPVDWTFNTRGKPHEFSTARARSERDGRFRIEIRGRVMVSR